MPIMRHVFTLSMVPVVLTCAVALADTPASQPPEVTHTVDAFAGKWNFAGEVTLPGSTKPTKWSALPECTKTAGGRAVYCHIPLSKTPLGSIETSALIAYDVNDKRVHIMGVDSSGEMQSVKCQWADDKSLVCDPLSDVIDGKPATAELKYSWLDKKTYTAVAVVTMADGSKLSMTGTYKRR